MWRPGGGTGPGPRLSPAWPWCLPPPHSPFLLYLHPSPCRVAVSSERGRWVSPSTLLGASLRVGSQDQGLHVHAVGVVQESGGPEGFV